MRKERAIFRLTGVAAASVMITVAFSAPAFADDDDEGGRKECRGLPSHGELQAALEAASEIREAKDV